MSRQVRQDALPGAKGARHGRVVLYVRRPAELFMAGYVGTLREVCLILPRILAQLWVGVERVEPMCKTPVLEWRDSNTLVVFQAVGW